MVHGEEAIAEVGVQSTAERFNNHKAVWNYIGDILKQHEAQLVWQRQDSRYYDPLVGGNLVWGSAEEGILLLEVGTLSSRERYQRIACLTPFDEDGGVPSASLYDRRIDETGRYYLDISESYYESARMNNNTLRGKPPILCTDWPRNRIPFEIPVLIEAAGEPLEAQEAEILLRGMQRAVHAWQLKRAAVGSEAEGSVAEQIELIQETVQPLREDYEQKQAKLAAARERVAKGKAEVKYRQKAAEVAAARERVAKGNEEVRHKKLKASVLHDEIRLHNKEARRIVEDARRPALDRFNEATLQSRKELKERAESQEEALLVRVTRALASLSPGIFLKTESTVLPQGAIYRHVGTLEMATDIV